MAHGEFATKRVQTAPDATLAYEARGAGLALLAFHGAYSGRVEVVDFLEPMLRARPLRRIYIDLPGHGDSRPSTGLKTADDALDLVDALLDAENPDDRFLLVGHSYGGLFARAVAARHPDRVAGMALICPMMSGEQRLAAPAVVRDDGVSAELDAETRAAYEGYFVVRTAETLERFRRAVAPAAGEVEDETLAAMDSAPFSVDPDEVTLTAPVLVMSGRYDSWVGWERQQRLGDPYPRATVVTVADAGHALPHERPELVTSLLEDWLDRAGLDERR